MRVTPPGRRDALSTILVAASFLARPMCPPAFARTMRELSNDEKLELDLQSRTASGMMLPSGIRVIDVNKGDPEARLPAKGERVYCHFKVWTGGFRNGEPVDSSFRQTRPYDWLLGEPDERIRPGFDEGTKGMREGECVPPRDLNMRCGHIGGLRLSLTPRAPSTLALIRAVGGASWFRRGSRMARRASRRMHAVRCSSSPTRTCTSICS